MKSDAIRFVDRANHDTPKIESFIIDVAEAAGLIELILDRMLALAAAYCPVRRTRGRGYLYGRRSMPMEAFDRLPKASG